jgi:hypothetical protein
MWCLKRVIDDASNEMEAVQPSHQSSSAKEREEDKKHAGQALACPVNEPHCGAR